jgi:hypothetical protein
MVDTTMSVKNVVLHFCHSDINQPMVSGFIREVLGSNLGQINYTAGFVSPSRVVYAGRFLAPLSILCAHAGKHCVMSFHVVQSITSKPRVNQ